LSCSLAVASQNRAAGMHGTGSQGWYTERERGRERDSARKREREREQERERDTETDGERARARERERASDRERETEFYQETMSMHQVVISVSDSEIVCVGCFFFEASR